MMTTTMITPMGISIKVFRFLLIANIFYIWILNETTAMKNIVTFLFVFTVMLGNAQQKLVPGDKSIETRWIKDESYSMKWYTVRDTVKFEIARVVTTIDAGKDKLNVYTDVQIRNAKTQWVDTTIVALPSLKPVRHASYNLEREVVVNYGKKISGHQEIKQAQKKTPIDETSNETFFDGSFYPYVIRLLPLQEGYTKDISIYNFNPGKSSVLTASVKSVHSAIYKSKKGKADVWEVIVTDEMGNGVLNSVTYYIGKSDRKLYKQLFKNNGQNMMMELVE